MMDGLTAICPCCHEAVLFADVTKRPMNTAYEDYERNFMVSCLACWELSEEHWKDMWADYYRDRL